jgi:hypothetical protein
MKTRRRVRKEESPNLLHIYDRLPNKTISELTSTLGRWQVEIKRRFYFILFFHRYGPELHRMFEIREHFNEKRQFQPLIYCYRPPL